MTRRYSLVSARWPPSGGWLAPRASARCWLMPALMARRLRPGSRGPGPGGRLRWTRRSRVPSGMGVRVNSTLVAPGVLARCPAAVPEEVPLGGGRCQAGRTVVGGRGLYRRWRADEVHDSLKALPRKSSVRSSPTSRSPSTAPESASPWPSPGPECTLPVGNRPARSFEPTSSATGHARPEAPGGVTGRPARPQLHADPDRTRHMPRYSVHEGQSDAARRHGRGRAR